MSVASRRDCVLRAILEFLGLFLLWGDDKIGMVGGMESWCLYLESKSPCCFWQMDGMSEDTDVSAAPNG